MVQEEADNPMRSEAGVARSFLEAVAATPEAIALASGSEEWTYATLLRRSAGVAGYLQTIGVDPGSRVGVAYGRDFRQIVGILGTLLAGATYVPIDADQPPERTDEMVEDAGLRLILADSPGDRGGLSGQTPILSLTGRVQSGPIHEARPSGPEDTAYIIFTSGSTGRPKGVEIVDRGIVALVEAVDAIARRHGVNRVLQFASPTFDASVWEMFPALLKGRCLWFSAADPGRLDPAELIGEAVEAGVDMMTLPPSYLMAADPGRVARMPAVTVVAGEPCPPALVRRWSTRTALYNAYGPTEVTVAATIARCSEGDAHEVPIGLPLPHVQIAVLDRGSAVTEGRVGELFLGGPSLAKGYLGDPALTTDRFRLIETNGETHRMYATGDLVRRRPDGQLTFVERADRQVKLRGHRVELGDVEAALLRIPGVEQATAMAVGADGLLDRLVAFVSGRSVDPEATRAEVARARPAYMVPSEIIAVDSWPTTSSGKIDLAALQEILDARRVVERRNHPEGELRRALAEHWEERLEVEGVTPGSDFFDLGGHSLMVIGLLSGLRRDLGIELTTRQVYENPRFEDFCRVAEAVEAETRAPGRRA